MSEKNQIPKKYHESLFYRMPMQTRRQLERAFVDTPAAPMSRFWIGGAVLASVLALCLTFSLGRFSARESMENEIAQEVVSAHVRSMMATHLSDVVSTDQHTVKPWFEGRLDFGPSVKDFALKEFPLIGGRLDYLGSRSVAALIYKRGQHVINVFEWPAVETDDTTPRFSTRRGYHIFSWRRSGLQYWAISDLNANDLQTFVGLWQASE